VEKIHSIEDNITLAGKPAYRVDASFNGPIPHGIQYFMVDEEKNTGYYILCAMMEEDYTNYKPICHKMADSLRIAADSDSMNSKGTIL
jgi:hypothetical protein